MASQPQIGWLAENGPKELELLFRAIVYHPAAPILLADNDRRYRDASVGASKLLGLPRDKIIGRSLDDFAAPGFRPIISERWRSFLESGEQEGTLELLGPDGGPRDIEYSAKKSVLPVRHLLVLRDKGGGSSKYTSARTAEDSSLDQVPGWVQDYALFLLDADGRMADWYAGAERIYGYHSSDVIGQHVSILYPDDEALRQLQEALKRAASEGHVGAEGWHVKKNGTRFWANVITMALKDDKGVLRGFARVVRDFTGRHQRDQKLQRGILRHRQLTSESTIAGIVTGEFDRIREANDAFLELIGYSRDDLRAGRVKWPDLTPSEYVDLDEFAHEEGLRFGACTPFEKQLIRRDGSRIPVLVATAVLKLSPFRWITFVQDLRGRDRLESVDDEEEVFEIKHKFEEIVGSSVAMKRLMAQVELVAPTDANVLILGETGTGKELIARAIHKSSQRSGQAFIAVNCASIPPSLIGSELFGHETGAFTGALQRRQGRFEMANSGTIFLDEIGELPAETQIALLRVLQERQFERVEGSRAIPTDVRIIAATNRDYHFAPTSSTG